MNTVEQQTRPEPKTLILGSMPLQTDPERVIAAGPWCFTGREDFFPDWEDHFTFLPEPFAERELQKQAMREAESLAVDMIPRLADRLHHLPLPEQYWETLLAPYTITVSKLLVTAWYYVQAMVQAGANECVKVELLPSDCQFDLKTDSDVVLHAALNPLCIHWVFSQLLRPVVPKTWQVTELGALEIPCPHEAPRTLKAQLKAWLVRCSLKLPFPKLKGMSIAQALRYSLALWHTSKTPDDESRSLDTFFSARFTEADSSLPLDPLPIFLMLLPQSLRELTHPPLPENKPFAKVRIASTIAYEDAHYRQELALWRAQGGRLGYVQHGGNYGMMSHICAMELVEYSQHLFCTWGWQEHESCFGDKVGTGNFVPMPYPWLAKHKDRWRQTSEHILFVGTEMPGFPYQLDMHPTPLEFVQYREDKQWFLEALGENLRAQVLYRPYFSVPCTLDDASWLLMRFPEVHLCSGPLEPHLLGCKLLVLDHHGTTLIEAMVANIPCVCYWEEKAWPLTPLFQSIVEKMRAVGIYHPSAEEAAVHVGAIAAAPKTWWLSEEVQAVRQAFLQHFALVPTTKSCDQMWVSFLKKL